MEGVPGAWQLSGLEAVLRTQALQGQDGKGPDLCGSEVVAGAPTSAQLCLLSHRPPPQPAATKGFLDRTLLLFVSGHLPRSGFSICFSYLVFTAAL